MALRCFQQKRTRRTRLGKQGNKVQKPNDCVAVFWFFFIIVLILIRWWGLRARSGGGKPGPRTKGYFRREYYEQMEIDLRLPYKRFKQIYPYSKITYQE
jgi:hypothetical protein